VHEKQKNKGASEYIFIMIEIMIFVGPSLVGEAIDYHTYLVKDSVDLFQTLPFRLAHNDFEVDEDDDNIVGISSDSSDPFVQ